MNKTNWKSVVLFFLIACLWSWPFFWWRDIHPESWKALDIPRYLKTWSFMWGPGIAALVCLLIFRKTHERVMTFKGTSLKHGLAFYLVLPIAIAVVHQDFKFLGLGVLGFISILGEELGWRGFLQDALKMKSDFLKALLMGALWEIWHFTAHTVNSGAIVRVAIFIVITTVFSLISIELTKKTKSLFIPVALHMALDALFEFERGWQSVLICLPLWAWIFISWRKSMNTQPATTN